MLNSPTLFDFMLDHPEVPTHRQIAVRVGSRLLLLLMILCGLAYIGRAQEAPHTLPLITPEKESAPTITDKDIVTLSPAQVEALQAYQAFQPMRDRAYAQAQAQVDQQLQATPQYKRMAAANEKLNKAADKVYKAHGLKPSDYFICYGPAEGPCKDAPAEEYVWRKNITETADKAPGTVVVGKEVAKKEAPKAK